MKLFYAYLKDAKSDEYYRKLLTFVNREAADEWWRMISTTNSPYAGRVKRMSPQFYVQSADESRDNVIYLIYYDRLPGANQLLEKMFISGVCQKEADHPSIIPPTDITDHISGKWYFIQSKADPWSHWYLRTRGTCLVCGDAECGAIHVSSDYRTKFCVQVRNVPEDAKVQENFVMIGKDDVSIIAPKNFVVYINEEGDLRATRGYQGGIDLLFGDLKNRFMTRAEKQVNGEVWEYVESVERGSGEAWELAD